MFGQQQRYIFTSDSFDRQVDHRIYRLIRVAVNFWGAKVGCQLATCNLSTREQTIRLPDRPEPGLHRRLEDGIPHMVVLGDPLPSDDAGDDVVAHDKLPVTFSWKALTYVAEKREEEASGILNLQELQNYDQILFIVQNPALGGEALLQNLLIHPTL